MGINVISKKKNLKKNTVLLRADFNVPMKKGTIIDDTKIQASLPTIQYLTDKGAKVILVTHVGRPEGKVVPSLKVDPIVKKLSELLGKNVGKLETRNWKLTDKQLGTVVQQIDAMQAGDVMVMENIRFAVSEEQNDIRLAEQLSVLADIFVLDGFAVSHRTAASVTGVAKLLPSFAGLLFEKEIKGLSRVLEKPKAPFVVIMGGVKIETKLPVIQKLLPKVDQVLIGGGIVNTYLWALGYRVGDSVVDKQFKKQALQLLKKKKIVKPVDVVVGTSNGKQYRVVELKKTPHQICKKGEMILDIGPKTVQLYSLYIKSALTLVWNGAMGYFEQKPYDVGTLAIARLVATVSKGPAYGVIGGGETIQAMERVKMLEWVDLVSTGGGAMLEFLSGKKLPGMLVLEK